MSNCAFIDTIKLCTLVRIPAFRRDENMETNKIKYILAAVMVALCGMIWFGENRWQEPQQDGTTPVFQHATEVPADSSAKEMIYVHITGAVKKPGVYVFDKPPRVVEVVEEAGGFTKDAVKSEVNQAELVEDGVQIVIASKRERKTSDAGESGGRGEPSAGDSLLDINTATKEELMTLTGIGESKAVSIITYRETNGKFRKIEDIKKITGIKDGIFEKIKSRIKV